MGGEAAQQAGGVTPAACVRIEQIFNASRARVFDAWTRPDLLAQWYAPHGCALHIEHIDVRTGGSYHMCVRDPSFGECWTIGTYVEVVRPERLVFTAVIADAGGRPATPESQGHDPAWPAETVVRVTFAACGEQTVVTLEQDADEALAMRTGAHAGWLGMFDRLGAHLAAPAV